VKLISILFFNTLSMPQVDINKIVDKANIFAVVGASNDEQKYGYKMYKLLKEGGYKVYPVNPNRDTIQGDKSYPTLNDLPEKPNVVSVITPPSISNQVLDQALNLGIDTIWFQPGAEDEQIKTKAKENPGRIIHNMCLLTTLMFKEQLENGKM
jgi:predicted CoA-binding protein